MLKEEYQGNEDALSELQELQLEGAEVRSNIQVLDEEKDKEVVHEPTGQVLGRLEEWDTPIEANPFTIEGMYLETGGTTEGMQTDRQNFRASLDRADLLQQPTER